MDKLLSDSLAAKTIRIKYGLDDLFNLYKSSKKKGGEKLLRFSNFLNAVNLISSSPNFIKDVEAIGGKKEPYFLSGYANPLTTSTFLKDIEKEREKNKSKKNEEENKVFWFEYSFFRDRQIFIRRYNDDKLYLINEEGYLCMATGIYSNHKNAIYKSNLKNFPLLNITNKKITVEQDVGEFKPLVFEGNFWPTHRSVDDIFIKSDFPNHHESVLLKFDGKFWRSVASTAKGALFVSVPVYYGHFELYENAMMIDCFYRSTDKHHLCEYYKCDIEAESPSNFEECLFEGCKIKYVSDSQFTNCTFKNCEFDMSGFSSELED